MTDLDDNVKNDLIEFVGKCCDKNPSNDSSNQVNSHDCFESIIHSLNINSTSSITSSLLDAALPLEDDNQPSLMEQMMKETVDSKEKENNKHQCCWQKETERPFVFRKGFLNSSRRSNMCEHVSIGPSPNKLRQSESITTDLNNIVQVEGIQESSNDTFYLKDMKHNRVKEDSDDKLLGHFMSSFTESMQRKMQRKDQKDKNRIEAGEEAKLLGNDVISLEQRKKMNSILSNEEIVTILCDPAMQTAMKECANPDRMYILMRDEEFGPKLRRLMKAGLLELHMCS